MSTVSPQPLPPVAPPANSAFDLRLSGLLRASEFGLRTSFDLRPSTFVLPLAAVACITFLAALHNHGLAFCGAFAWFACFLLPLAVGARPAAWLAWPRRGWLFPVSAAFAGFALPTAAVAAFVHFQLGALLYHPSAADTFRWLAAQAAAVAALAAAEEFFFRGWLQQTVLARTRRPVLWGALVFALAHVVVTDWLWPTPGWLVSGLALGWVTRRVGGSLWPALLLHAAGNLALAWTKLLVSMNLPFFAP